MYMKKRRYVLKAAAGLGVGAGFPLFKRAAFAQSTDKAHSPKEFVQRVNAQLKADYATAEAAAKEEEKRGQFASLAPPGQLVPFLDWDYYYTKGTRARWSPNAGQTFKAVYVPEGFVTDLASIPQGAWSLGLRPEGRYAYAALVHDYLYWTQEPARSREEADKIFLYAMEDWKVPVGEREAFYKILRLAGGAAWEKNASLKRAGEKRVLKKYPDPTIAWSVWKQKPENFSD